MKLLNVSIRRYRSIEDGSSFSLERDVTSLVGKNESGKSAVLQALYKSNPIQPKVSFDQGLDFPTTKARERKGRAPVQVTLLTYEMDDADVQAVEDSLGPNTVLDRTFTVETGYNYEKIPFVVQIDQAAVVAHLLKGVELTPSDAATIEGIKDSATLLDKLKSLETPTQAVTGVIEKVNSWRDGRASLQAIKILSSRRPKFVYFDDYDSMPGLVSIPDLVTKRDDEELTRSEQAVVSLLAAAGADLEDFLEPESQEHLVRDSENASNAISEEVFEFWSQNKQLAVKIRLMDKPDTGALPPLNKAPLLQIRVENKKHSVTVPFDERSRGFVWFFSFLAYFSHIEQESDQPLILLLDEPGINLHASAQSDLLRFIDERLAPKHQVIFSTHSPFMIDPHALHRVRTVIDADNKGTVISSEVMYADAETSFPLHAAMGVDLSKTLFVSPDTLVVEGPSDLMYLEVLSQALVAAGREGLSERWSIAPVGGIAKLPAFVSLLGANKLNIAVLADAGFEDAESIRKLEAAGKLADAGIILISEVVGRNEADVEDLFDQAFYVKLVNGAYKSHLDGQDIKVGDLPKGDRITKRVEAVMKERGINKGRLNHYTPAKYLLQKQGTLKLSSTTLDRAEQLLKKINNFLSS
ncbi:Predicted ATP-binding protein involved in virulence [Mycobacteroides abscessus subsp. bolletii]|nr:Predicted ATP-binding protein involved in virulence [Mycobacteroides abscessus subsp. bolletii]